MFRPVLAQSHEGDLRPRRARDLFLVANNIHEMGGVQQVGHTLAGMFAARGHRVRLIGVRPFEPQHPYPVSAYTTHVLGPFAPTGPDRVQPADIEALDGLLGRADNGIVICMQVHAMNWLAAAETSHLRIIGQSHESFAGSVGFTDRRNSRYRRIMRLYRDIDCCLLLDPEDARHFRRCGLNNTAVMRNPLHMRAAAPAPLEKPTIITVGRLAPEKNHRRMLDAFALLADEFPSWRLRIVGDGPLRDDLVRYASDRGLGSRVDFTGISYDVQAELTNSSIFALTSDTEGVAMGALEAMACGVPCVSFDCSPGLRELVDDGPGGIIVPQGAVPQLAEGLRRLICDVGLRRAMGAAAYEAAHRYSPGVLDEWEHLFEWVER